MILKNNLEFKGIKIVLFCMRKNNKIPNKVNDFEKSMRKVYSYDDINTPVAKRGTSPHFRNQSNRKPSQANYLC